MGLFGPPNIEKMLSKRDIKGLIKALGYQQDKGVQKAASKALVKIGTDSVDPLIAWLMEGNDYVRCHAAETLGELSDPHTVKSLIVALTDNVKSVREAAATAIKNIGSPAIDPLIVALKDDKWSIRKAAIEALSNLEDPRAVIPLIMMLNNKSDNKAAHDALIRIGTSAVEPLIVTLNKNDDNLRLEALNLLGQIGDSRAVEPLIAALKDGYAQVRSRAVQGLGQIKDVRAIEPLIDYAFNANLKEVHEIGYALCNINNPDAIQILFSALTNNNYSIRKASVILLFEIGISENNLTNNVIRKCLHPQHYDLHGEIPIYDLIVTLERVKNNLPLDKILLMVYSLIDGSVLPTDISHIVEYLIKYKYFPKVKFDMKPVIKILDEATAKQPEFKSEIWDGYKSRIENEYRHRLIQSKEYLESVCLH